MTGKKKKKDGQPGLFKKVSSIFGSGDLVIIRCVGPGPIAGPDKRPPRPRPKRPDADPTAGFPVSEVTVGRLGATQTATGTGRGRAWVSSRGGFRHPPGALDSTQGLRRRWPRLSLVGRGFRTLSVSGQGRGV